MIPSAITEEERYTMVNLRGHTTGLPMNIWIGPRSGARHAARIKVQMDHRERFNLRKLAVVSVEGTATPARIVAGNLSTADLELVRHYVALNREAIIAHWREETDGGQLLQMLKPLQENTQ